MPGDPAQHVGRPYRPGRKRGYRGQLDRRVPLNRDPEGPETGNRLDYN